MTSNYRRVETNIPVYNPEGLAEDGECRSKSGDSIVKESQLLNHKTKPGLRRAVVIVL